MGKGVLLGVGEKVSVAVLVSAITGKSVGVTMAGKVALGSLVTISPINITGKVAVFVFVPKE